jgi:hypothetical protein
MGGLMKTVYRIHVVMYQIETDDQGEERDLEIVGEEELAGYRDDFQTEQGANKVFEVVTGT